MSDRQRRRILFIAEGVSMAHPTRLFQLAQDMNQDEYEVHFATSKNYFDFLDFTAKGIIPHEIESLPTATFNDRLYKIQFPYTVEELRRFANEDKKLIGKVNPDLIVGDFRLSLRGSLAGKNIPWLNLIQYHWYPSYPRPEIIGNVQPVKFLTRFVVEKFSPVMAPIILKNQLKIINNFEIEFGAELSPSVFHFYCSGTHLLFPDLPEIFEATDSERGSFLGPLVWKNSKIDWPKNWPKENLFPLRKPTAYVSMGSTGDHRLTPRVVQTLLENNYNVFLSTAGAKTLVDYPAEVRHSQYLPADLILQQSDLFIGNGGTSTTYHALSYGIPIFAFANNLDQCLHMNALKQKGFGDFLTSDNFDDRVLDAFLKNSRSIKRENLEFIRHRIQHEQSVDKLDSLIRRYI